MPTRGRKTARPRMDSAKLLAEQRLEDAREALRSRKISSESAESVERLEDLLARARRGMLPYTNLTVRELYRIRASRGLGDQKLRCTANSAARLLIHKLEQADDDSKFERFLEFPPELRNRIYELVLVHRTEDEAVKQPIDPLKATPSPTSAGDPRGCDSWRQASRTLAVTRTNQQLRAEALPIFYGMNTFVFDIERVHVRYSAFPNNDPVRNVMRLMLWIHNIVELKNLGFIRNLNVAFSDDGHVSGAGFHGCAMRVRVSLRAEGVDVIHENHEDDEFWGCGDCKAKNARVQDVMDVFTSGRTGVKLNRKLVDDLLALCLHTE